jgi:hypothetical protein
MSVGKLERERAGERETRWNTVYKREDITIHVISV